MNKIINVRDTVLKRNTVEFTGMTVKLSLVSSLFLSERKTRSHKASRLSGQKRDFCTEVSGLFDLLEKVVS